MKEEATSQGIVLKVMPYKENDLILTVYFREYGKLSVIAQGARKQKSKNAAGCQPFVQSEFTLFLHSGLSRLVRAVPIKSYRYLQEDLSSQSIATFLCEYYYRGIEENQPNLENYQFLKAALEHLDQGYPSDLVYLFMIAFILKDCGSEMIVDHCALCDDCRQIVSVSIRDGGFVCLKHCHDNDPFYPVEVLRLIRYVNRLSIFEMDQIETNQSTILEAKRIMESFLDEYCPIHFLSRKFIK